MTKQFKEKVPQVTAVEVTDVLNQLAEVANMIGATEAGMTIRDGKKVGVFKVESEQTGQTHEVNEGQVIATDGDIVQVMDSSEFYAKYEVV